MESKIDVSFSDHKFRIVVSKENEVDRTLIVDGTEARHVSDRLLERLNGPTSAPKTVAPPAPAPAPADHATVIPPVVPPTANPAQPEVEQE